MPENYLFFNHKMTLFIIQNKVSETYFKNKS